MFDKKIYMKEWQKAHSIHRKNWIEKNKEKINENARNWRKENKDKVKKYQRNWRLKNSEKVKEQRRRYKLKNKEKILEYQKKPEVIWGRYKYNAQTRKLPFKITLDELTNFIFQDCHYCGEKPNPLNGIDRKDNNIGYIKENCLTCCKECNRLKGASEYKEFLFRCNKINIWQIKKKKLL